MTTLWILLYQALSLAATPLMHLWLRYRRTQGKEHATRLKERFGIASLPRPEGQLVWMHAASVGESISVLPLIARLLEATPHLDPLCAERAPPARHLLLTTGTVTSAAMMESKLPSRAFHQFAPVDSPLYVRRFLAHWRPDLALFVESELWPNLILETKAPVLILNGRMSQASFRWWQRYRPLARAMFAHITKVLAQGEGDAERFRRLGAHSAVNAGNLKFDAAPLPADPNALRQLQQAVGARPVWLAASTHEGEEEQIASAHRILREHLPGILTILVPRHATRGEAIEQMLTAQGLNVACRSQNDELAGWTDIYLADTMGELGLFYRLAPVVFIGGSLVPHGGQNPLEPARLHCAILCGPHMTNFPDIMETLHAHHAILEVEDAADLAHQVAHLLGGTPRREALDKAAYELVSSKKGVLETILRTLQPYLTT